MAGIYFYAVRYELRAFCLAPLRTGSVDGDPETVLLDGDGVPLLPGSSIAGALRGWLTRQGKAEVAAELFGTPAGPGSLMVSDGLFDPDSQRSIRPRLRIDGATGTAAKGAKFDLAQVDSGARLRFTVTWLGAEYREETLCQIEELLGALHSGLIRLGGQRSQGFGRVRLEAARRCYDLRREADRRDWLADRFEGEPLALPVRTDPGRAVFTLAAAAGSILVRAAAPAAEGDESWTRALWEGETPIVPGSSVKGAVRARASLIVRAAGAPESLVEVLFGREVRSGDGGLAGQARFADAVLCPERRKRLSRIRIDRFTGGVIRGGLFTEEPLCSPLSIVVTAPVDQPAACALLLFALRDLGLGLYPLGSGGAIGRGYLTGERLTVIVGGEEKAAFTFTDGRCALDDPEGMVAGWLSAWKEAI